MSRRWFPCIVVGMLAGSAFASDLTVIEAVWTTSITNRQYGPKVEPNSQARSIYFWTRLSGGKASLEELQKQGRLPIRHVWRFTNVFTSDTQGIDPSQERTLKVGNIVDQGGLSSLIDQTGRFTWRTWSHKDAVWGGTWTVTVQYSDGESLMCGNKPCQWSISLEE